MDSTSNQFCEDNLKMITDSANQIENPEFGLLFDIDGVLLRGLTPLPAAVRLFDSLKNEQGNLRVPTAFVTNSSGLTTDKANLLRQLFGIQFDDEQLIQAPTALKIFSQWHDKNVLFVGQNHIVEIAKELGFKKVVTLDQVKDAYPLLDMVDHANRKKVAQGYEEKRIEPIEAIVLLGEPVKWESHLQLLVDLLVTEGRPDHAPAVFPEVHLPILACNMDLVFSHQACMPRMAHGAFLHCLESLYLKITGHPLKYSALVGKPSEITFRYAEHVLTNVASRMELSAPPKRLYFFGDNDSVDILGSNLYSNYIKRFHTRAEKKVLCRDKLNKLHAQISKSPSRCVPQDAVLHPHSATTIECILVHTGVYTPAEEGELHQEKPNYCHRDFERASELDHPAVEVSNCLDGWCYILQLEHN